ncbi:hypothetical protein K505DRAFT_207904, partial [Melanomma pulvis-pyrius CBS 109.77]
ELICKFWPTSNISFNSFDAQDYAAFLQYIDIQLRQIRRHQRYFAVETLEGTFDIIETVRANFSQPRSHILQILSKKFLNVEAAAIQRSLELSVRLWLTFNVNSSNVIVGPTFANEIPLDWDENASLETLVQNQFPKGSASSGLTPRSKIDPSFTAACLANICGVKLYWTDNIANHLRFDSTRQVLTVYKHKICLVNHLSADDDCIPKEVLRETLDTLNLLFPFGDLATKQLLMKEGQLLFYGLGNCNRGRQLNIEEYKYYREELEHLIDSFNRPPRTWKQLATDRRNKLEWSAFWITVMVAVLTMVSIPCNVIQAMYSVKAYHATL